MSVVLGIDAAWTAGQPSGVSLAVHEGVRWRLRAVAPSYDHFLSLAEGVARDDRPRGSRPDAAALLAAAETLAGARVDLVAIDMPLAHTPIVARRVSDNAITRAFGGRYCGTHSPSAERPGPLSDALRAGFEAAGYPLRTDDARPGGLIEVYPHPALVVLAQAARRLSARRAPRQNCGRCVRADRRTLCSPDPRRSLARPDPCACRAAPPA